MLTDMIRDHLHNPPTCCRHRATKAVAEGLHIKIMATKRRGCGYRNEEPVKSNL